MGKTYRSCLLGTLAYRGQGLGPSCTITFFQHGAIVTVIAPYCQDKSFISLGNVGRFRIAMHPVCLQPESAGLQRTLY